MVEGMWTLLIGVVGAILGLTMLTKMGLNTLLCGGPVSSGHGWLAVHPSFPMKSCSLYRTIA